MTKINEIESVYTDLWPQQKARLSIDLPPTAGSVMHITQTQLQMEGWNFTRL